MNAEFVRPNPWAKGDAREKELGPQEVARIGFLKKVEAFERERSHAKYTAWEHKRLDREATENAFCLSLAKSEGLVLHEGFVLTGKGTLDMQGRGAGPENEASLLRLVWITRDVDSRTDYTPENLRLVAAHLNKRYPEIVFTFDEDRSRSSFAYTAALPTPQARQSL